MAGAAVDGGMVRLRLAQGWASLHDPTDGQMQVSAGYYAPWTPWCTLDKRAAGEGLATRRPLPTRPLLIVLASVAAGPSDACGDRDSIEELVGERDGASAQAGPARPACLWR